MDFVRVRDYAPQDLRGLYGQYFEWQGYFEFKAGTWANNGLTTYCNEQPGPSILLGTWTKAAPVCEPGWEAAGFSYCRKPPVCCTKRVGNPIDVGTGAKLQTETDIPTMALSGLQFVRNYSSQGFMTQGSTQASIFGSLWRHNYQRKLVYVGNGATPVAFVLNADGQSATFRKIGGANGVWTARSFSTERFAELTNSSGAVVGWRYTTSNDTTEEYDLSGKLVSITDRTGLAQTMAYTDGTAAGANGAIATDTGVALPAGLLLSVTDSFGRQLRLSYRGDSMLVGVTDPAGGLTAFGYDSIARLKTVTYPDGRTRTYVYYTEEPLPVLTQSDGLLTGILDETGARIGTYAYDGYRRAISSQGAGQVNNFTVAYSWTNSIPNASGSQISGLVWDPNSTLVTSKLVSVNGIYHSAGETKPCSAPGCTGTVSSSVGYDANGNVAFRTDFRGNRTNYSYDIARALETSRTEGLSSSGGTTIATRTSTIAWPPTLRLPATITEPVAGGTKTTTNTYDANGNLTQRQVTTPAGSRYWSWTYDGFGRVLTATDPLGRTSVNTYYPNTAAQNTSIANSRGMLASTTNAAGHTTTITAYNAYGQPLSMADANGLVTNMTYDVRQRLTSRSVAGETTTYEYNPVGQLSKATTSDGSTLQYTYDAAQRLTQIQDGLGNKMVYTLDYAGNRVKEDAVDPLGALARTRSRVYDGFNRLQKDIGGLGAAQTTTYAYDANDNQTGMTDPLNRVTTNLYDALNRLIQVNDPLNGAAAPTKYEYDAQDNLTKVTDPKNLATTYTYNGFNELVSQASPDTGTTTFTYDAAGNMLTKTDARGVTVTYSYDVLNRVTSIGYPATTGATGNSPAQTVSYVYDSCGNGKGRLCSFTDRTGTTTYSYDLQGRVLSKAQNVNGLTQTIAYRYNAAGQMDEMTMPSGKRVAVNYVNNRITGLTVDGQPVVKTAEYEPFGPIGEWTWGNDSVASPNKHTRYFDLDGRNTKIESGNSIDPAIIVYDAASRITALQRLTSNTVDPSKSASFGYDNLDRLTTATPGAGNAASAQSYGYDAIGNRLTNNINGSLTSYSYGTTSHRLNALTGSTAKTFGYDAAGNRLTDGIQSWIYGGDGRPSAISLAGANPTSIQSGINALGQRVLKTVNSGSSGSTTRFVYDEAGRLIGEYDIDGKPIQETIWLNDLPVAVLK
jgi:YD repeat-containing protein